MNNLKKVFVFGIDGAMPEKVFGEWIDELPTIRKIMQQGCYAKLNSCIPPLSIVAWTSITTGKNPSEHGIFECLYRKRDSYEFSSLTTYKNVKEKSIWQIVSEKNKKSIICLIPLTWPIKSFDGIMVTGFLTPGTNKEYTQPKELKQEIGSLFGGPFLIETKNPRDLSKEKLLKRCYKTTQMHFKLMNHLIKNKKWDLFFGVLGETDKMNHNFWRYCDPQHRKYEPNSKFKNILKEYYKFIDRKLGKLIALLPKDTLIIVLSDHGINRMHNRVNLSDWLIKEGYLVLKEELKINKPCKLETYMIDWTKTKVFINGVLEGQIFINLKGREKSGIVDLKDYNNLLNELEQKIKKIPGEDDKILNTKIFKKGRDFDGKCREITPDMIIYFDDLQYGCNPSKIGNPTLWSPSTALWSDDAGHSRQGIFIMNCCNKKGDLDEVDILDIAPTILNKLDIQIPEDMKGKVIT